MNTVAHILAVALLTYFLLDYYVSPGQGRVKHVCAKKTVRVILGLALVGQIPLLLIHASDGGDAILKLIASLVGDTSIRSMLFTAITLFMFSILAGALVCHSSRLICRREIATALPLKVCYIVPPAVAGLCIAFAS